MLPDLNNHIIQAYLLIVTEAFPGGQCRPFVIPDLSILPPVNNYKRGNVYQLLYNLGIDALVRLSKCLYSAAHQFHQNQETPEEVERRRRK